MLSVGHDEYWSAPMRDNLEAFIAKGGNVAFFSGNTCCWQVRSEDDGRAPDLLEAVLQLTTPSFRPDDHACLSTLWSHHLVNRPENQLTGVGFLWGGYHRSHGQFMDGSGAFTVHRPDHWLFAGTDLKRGDVVRRQGHDRRLRVRRLRVHGGRTGCPRRRAATARRKDFLILATCPARWHPDDCEWYERFPKDRTGAAVMGLYTKGGTVFTCGSTDWAHGLRGKRSPCHADHEEPARSAVEVTETLSPSAT